MSMEEDLEEVLVFLSSVPDTLEAALCFGQSAASRLAKHPKWSIRKGCVQDLNTSINELVVKAIEILEDIENDSY